MLGERGKDLTDWKAEIFTLLVCSKIEVATTPRYGAQTLPVFGRDDRDGKGGMGWLRCGFEFDGLGRDWESFDRRIPPGANEAWDGTPSGTCLRWRNDCKNQ